MTKPRNTHSRRTVITGAAAMVVPVTLPLLPLASYAGGGVSVDAGAAKRLAEFQRLIAKLDNREVAKLEAFMRPMTKSQRTLAAGVAS